MFHSPHLSRLVAVLAAVEFAAFILIGLAAATHPPALRLLVAAPEAVSTFALSRLPPGGLNVDFR